MNESGKNKHEKCSLLHSNPKFLILLYSSLITGYMLFFRKKKIQPKGETRVAPFGVQNNILSYQNILKASCRPHCMIRNGISYMDFSLTSDGFHDK